MLKRNIFIVAIIILTTAFAANTFGQNSKRGKISKPKANVQSPTTQKPKTPKSHSDRWWDFYDPAGTLGVEDRANPKDYESSARKTKPGTKVTRGTIPVYKNVKGKNSAQKRTKLSTQRGSKTKGVWEDDWLETKSVRGKSSSATQRRPNRRKN